MALNNLALTYNPQAGTLDTNANLGELVHQIESDPTTLLCGFLSQADKSGQLCDLAGSVLKRATPFGTRVVVRRRSSTSRSVASWR